MPIISTGDRKGWHGKIAILIVYTLLILGGGSMVYPFLVTLSGSMSNAYDYERRLPYPRFLFSDEDRLMRLLCSYFPPEHFSGTQHLRGFFADVPEHWQSWSRISDDREGSARWARTQLDKIADPAQADTMRVMAADYNTFLQDWDLNECVLAYDSRYLARLLRERYQAVGALNEAWNMAVDDFTEVTPPVQWNNEPFHQPSHTPGAGARHEDLLAMRQAYLENRFMPFLRNDPLAAPSLRPMALAYTWEAFAAKKLGILDPDTLRRLPFPVTPDADAPVRQAWLEYLREQFPLRHIRIPVTPEMRVNFTEFLQNRFDRLDYFNTIMRDGDPDWEAVDAWEEVSLPPTVPFGMLGKIWMDFIRQKVPVEQWMVRDTLAERAYQQHALRRHGSLDAINQAYALDLSSVEQLRIPFAEAFLTTFDRHKLAFTWDMFSRNYRTVFDYLVLRGRAVFNTLVLILLTVLITLTVNPLAGYALSRFRLPQSEKIIVFCLATMAFPASVAAIPSFLLLRDLSLLNTFAALVLPSAGNGMAIFLLKGFFDSLPKELFEAATIDGAPEWRIFTAVALPLVKPILAVNLLSAFMIAYSGWDWAIIVCQKQSMWTVSVWTYQFSQLSASQPFAVMAAYMINSLPVFLVFLFCQRIIMRGIILPTMK